MGATPAILGRCRQVDARAAAVRQERRARRDAARRRAQLAGGRAVEICSGAVRWARDVRLASVVRQSVEIGPAGLAVLDRAFIRGACGSRVRESARKAAGIASRPAPGSRPRCRSCCPAPMRVHLRGCPSRSPLRPRVQSARTRRPRAIGPSRAKPPCPGAPRHDMDGVSRISPCTGSHLRSGKSLCNFYLLVAPAGRSIHGRRARGMKVAPSPRTSGAR